MMRLFLPLALMGLLASFPQAKALQAHDVAHPQMNPVIQIALLLDTSNSMDGLIDQAKAQLWSIVNDFLCAEKIGQRPGLEVALYEYGNDGLQQADGYIRMVNPFTDDLDLISEKLFSLKTNGGSEFCGHVIQSAVNGLQWKASDHNLRMIFIAGNEPFTQGNISYKTSCQKAIDQGVVVNTIFCGDRLTGISTLWEDGAKLARGRYLNIDHNHKKAYIACPQDEALTRLNKDLNNTYLPYGDHGARGRSRQKKQDRNAHNLSKEGEMSRIATKSSRAYNNASWDLLDAYDQDKQKLEMMDAEDLPTEMQSMNPDERKAHLENLKSKRKAIQTEIQKLSQERAEYIAKQQTQNNDLSLDSALKKIVRELAQEYGWGFSEK